MVVQENKLSPVRSGPAKAGQAGKMNIRKPVQALVVAAIIAALVYFIIYNAGTIKKILIIKPSYIALLVGLLVAGRLLAGLRIKVIVGISGVKLSFMEWFGTAVITNFYNCFMFKGGVALTAVYLKQNHRLNYSKYVSLTIGAMSLVGLSSAIVGLTCSFYGYSAGAFSPVLMAIFGAMLAGMALVMIMPVGRFPQKPVFKYPNTLLQSWDALRGDKKAVSQLFVLETCVLVIFAVRYYITFRMFETPVPLYICFILSPFNIISNVLSIVPNGYGVREAMVGLAAKLARTGFTEGVMATVVNRVLMMIVSFIMAPVFSYFLVGNFKLKVRTDGNQRGDI